ncbi:MAG: glycoside hydrolase family 30 protein [Bacteroidota bacterium]|nr:glycoside hydrolase family 30 protein [Bacteroidota bacterium]
MDRTKYFYIAIYVLSYFWGTETSSAQGIIWKCTQPGKSWYSHERVESTSSGKDTTATYITVNPHIRYQQIDGWGGCFNERGWDALSALSSSERTDVIKAFFDPEEGCKLNFGRTPIGCSDYSTDWYSYNETPGDYKMHHFSIQRDKAKQIPFIKTALSIRPDLKLWGVPWSAPTWMKDSKDIFLVDPRIQQAYALYFSKYITEYKREGINVFMIMPENEEPNMHAAGNPVNPFWTHFSNEMEYDFIKNYLIPRFKADHPDCEIWLGTLHGNQYDFVEKCLNDPDIEPYIKGVGCQWSAMGVMHQTAEKYKSKKLMQTETKCNIDLEPLRQVNNNDWSYGVDQWVLVKGYLEAGANSYMLWNLVLDETGYSITNWAQCSPVVVNKKTKEITYNPQFYAFKHFSYFVEPGAYRIESKGNFTDQIAFVNPNGDVVLEIQNSHSVDKRIAIDVAGKKYTPELPAHSWNTFIVRADQFN